MAHSWHWVSVMGTNIKINIFETLPVTSANVKKNIATIFFKHDGIYKYFNVLIFYNHNCKRLWSFNQNQYHFRNNTWLRIFVHFTNSSLSHASVTHAALEANPVSECINNSSQNTLLLLVNVTIFFVNV